MDEARGHTEKVFFHVDLDAFYAAVEQLDHPEHRGKPVIIGALPGHRGVVSACSYEARVFGVHSAMPISQAYARCPHGVYLVPRMKRYSELSKKVMALFGSFSPDVRQISIDEATLDMTGTERLFGTPEEAARKLKTMVAEETGLIISVGIAPNRYLAKLASEYDKPDGLFRVHCGKEEDFLDKLALKDLWGVGEKTLARLGEIGITTVAELRGYSQSLLQAMLGNAAGTYLYHAARGNNPGIYSLAPKSRSISSELTFGVDTDDREAIKRALLDLSHQVMFRSIDESFKSKTVQLKLRYGDFSTTTAQTTSGHFISSAEEVYNTVLALLEKRWNGSDAVRLVGVGLTALETADEPAQGELFGDSYEKKNRVESAILSYHKSRKGGQIVKASLLKGNSRSGDPAND
ncbi:MAG: DNA polymerase IV [Spirochaetales bacterium]|nr:DNA polymerase IV [Spirochaetales bacterium]